jgi:DNA-binding FrmR family transcriptional regulator
MQCNEELIHRIKRIEGQIGGIRRMMENTKTCEDMVIQLKAVRANIDKTISILTTLNLQQVLTIHPDDTSAVQEALDLIVKSR